MGQRTAHSMRFQIAFADQEQTVLVAEIVPIRAVRVMAGSHRVDVHALHLPDLLDHNFPRHSPSGFPEVLVPVDPPDDQTITVEIDHTGTNFNVFEAEAARFHVQHRSVRREKLKHGGVKRGMIGRPQADGIQRHADTGGVGRRHTIAAVIRFRPHLSLCGCQKRLLRIIEGHARTAGGKAFLPRHTDVGLELSRPAHHIRDRHPVDILYVQLRLRDQPHIPVNARQIPVILIFQIGAVRKAHHLERHQVFSGPDILRDAELRCQLAVLGIAHGFPVDPQVKCRLDSLEIQIQLTALHLLRQDEAFPVAAGGIFLRYMGRIDNALPFFPRRKPAIGFLLLKRERHIGINGFSKALHLPVGWNRDIRKRAVVVLRAVKVIHCLRRGVQPEAVGAVQTHRIGTAPIRAGQGPFSGIISAPAGMRGHPVDGKHLQILPIRRAVKLLPIVFHVHNSFFLRSALSLPQKAGGALTFFCFHDKLFAEKRT